MIDRAAYPFKGKSLAVSGGALHYLDEGRGETVLMVHGNPTWSFYFRDLVRALSADFRCLVPDHMGMGLSERPDDLRYQYTLRSRVDDLDALMRAECPEGPVTLVLHDWGGAIGMSWAARHSERVKRVIAMNTACFRIPATKTFPAALRFLRTAIGGVPLRTSSALRRLILNSCTSRRPLPKTIAESYLSVCDGWNQSRAFHRFVQDIPLYPGDPAWETLVETESRLGLLKNKPMLLLWGMKDWVFDRYFLDEWTRRFPHAEVRRFLDCGHFLLEDAGAEAVDLIRNFVGRPVPA